MIKGLERSVISWLSGFSELPEIFALSDRIIVMYEGEIRNCVDNYPGLRPEDIMQFALG